MKHSAVFLAALAAGLLASAWAQDKSYSGIHLYGQSHVNGHFRPNDLHQVKFPPDAQVQVPTQRPTATPSPYQPQYHHHYAQPVHPSPPPVIIRPVRPQPTTPSPAPFPTPSSQLPPTDSCSCVPLDQCTIENMDFSFAVACKHGQVRCCPSSPDAFRPPALAQPVHQPPSTRPTTTTTTAPPPPPIATRLPPAAMATVVPLSQPYSCQCRLAQECPTYAQRRGTCPPSLVTCCVAAEHSLGYAASFQPIDLPFQKVPNGSHPVPTWESGGLAPSSSNVQPAVVPPELQPGPDQYSPVQPPPETPRPLPDASTPLPPLPSVSPVVNRPAYLPPTQQQQHWPPVPGSSHHYPQYPPNYGPGSPYGSQYQVANSPYLQRPTPPPQQSYYQPNPYVNRPPEPQQPGPTQSPGLLSSLLSLFS